MDEDFDRFIRRWTKLMDRLFRELAYQTSMFEKAFYPYVYEEGIRLKVPDMDMRDEGDKYVIELDLPGVNKKDIDISLKDDRLIISAKRKENVKEKKEGYIRAERSYFGFRRVIELPYDADKNSIKAKYEDGVLRIEIKKVEGSTSGRINVE